MAEDTIFISDLEVLNDFLRRNEIPLLKPKLMQELTGLILDVYQETTKKKPAKNQEKTIKKPDFDQSNISEKPAKYQKAFNSLSKKIKFIANDNPEVVQKITNLKRLFDNTQSNNEALVIIKKLKLTLKRQFLILKNRKMLPEPLTEIQLLQKYKNAVAFLSDSKFMKIASNNKVSNYYQIESGVSNAIVRNLHQEGVQISRCTTNKVLIAMKTKRKKKLLRNKRISAAAAIILFIGIYCIAEFGIKPTSNNNLQTAGFGVFGSNEKKIIKPIFYPTVRSWEQKNRSLKTSEKSELLEIYKKVQSQLVEAGKELSEGQLLQIISLKLAK